MISRRKLDFFATLVVLQTCTITKGFVLLPNQLLSLQQQQRNQYYNPNNNNNNIPLFLASKTPDLNSQDPFIVLGLDPTVDKKEIKRAYKKMALKYHPDMTTTKDSTEAQKKRASAQFAKINWAYQTLMGKEQGTTTSTSSSRSSTTSSSGWTPPHRRSGPTASSSTDSKSTYSSTDWRDYIPNYNKYYNDDEYDTGGDSLGAIFADLFQAATSKSGSAGVFRDFVEFLEQTVEGYTSGSGSGGTDMDTLNVLLQTGSLHEIGEEMDETDLIVQQLNTKLQKVENELYMLKADLKVAVKFSEKLELEESIAELEARKDVVEGYLKKANKRLLKLQSRYKELIVNGDNDIRTSTARGRDDFYGTSSSASSSSSSRGPSGSTAGSSPSSTSSSASTGENEDEDAWKHDGFGSYGRRGSSRRRSRQSTTSTTSNAADSTRSSSSGSYSYARSEPSSSSSSRPSQPSSTNNNNNSRSQTPVVEPYLPPHRRTTSTGWSRQEEDRRRLSELKVDEEFDRLKKELGL